MVLVPWVYFKVILVTLNASENGWSLFLPPVKDVNTYEI